MISIMHGVTPSTTGKEKLKLLKEDLVDIADYYTTKSSNTNVANILDLDLLQHVNTNEDAGYATGGMYLRGQTLKSP